MKKVFIPKLVLLVLVLLALQGHLTTNALAQVKEGTGYPLPMIGHWNLGEAPNGFSPNYQIQLMEQGNHILPWFLMPSWNAQPDNPHWLEYYEKAIKKAAELKLPIALVSTQWEIWLSVEERYLTLSPAENPNVVTAEGKINREVSPVGGIDAWRDVGRRWTASPMMRKLQEWYPNPPYILFVSNNEHTKLPWNRLQEDKRYLEKYGLNKDDEFKRRVAADGWIERYRAMQAGLRKGLNNENWQAKAVFIGYNAFGPAHFGRWSGWAEHSLYNKGQIDPSALAWDGGSVPFYVFNWSAITDYTVFSPQVEAMNWVFMQAEARRQNPDFWFEMSVWNGNMPGAASDKLASYLGQGQSYSPERYKGMVQFGMWLLRPRVVREFRGWLETVGEFESYFLPLVKAVDQVHSQVVLRDFWQKGKLVANKANKHPYQTLVPVEYESSDRWFLLDTSLDPARPWQLKTPLPIYALALTQGKSPQRQWLVYAHAPLGEQKQAIIHLPDYHSIKVDVSVSGSFYLVNEKWQRVTRVQ
jgi:hypothetical protein